LGDIVRPNEDSKRALTDAFLATVGLQTVDKDEDTVPWYIPLSRSQKQLASTVSEYDYKVGLK